MYSDIQTVKGKPDTWRRHRKLYIAVAIITPILAATAITHVLWLDAVAKFLIVKDDLSPAEVIVVLGSGGRERLLHGVRLYQSGYGSKLILTGMKVEFPGSDTTWPQLAMREAISLGIPEDMIILEERPTSTYEDAVYVKEDMSARHLNSAIIVSSSPHMRRARMIFRKVFSDRKDISLQFSPADNGRFQVHKWWTREEDLVTVVNEYCKLVLYFFKYMI